MAAEAELEKKLGIWARSQGCLYYKFSSPARRGVPDRLIMGPTGKALFLELKAPGGKPTALQERELRILRGNGCRAEWTDNLQVAKVMIKQNCLETL